MTVSITSVEVTFAENALPSSLDALRVARVATARASSQRLLDGGAVRIHLALAVGVAAAVLAVHLVRHLEIHRRLLVADPRSEPTGSSSGGQHARKERPRRRRRPRLRTQLVEDHAVADQSGDQDAQKLPVEDEHLKQSKQATGKRPVSRSYWTFETLGVLLSLRIVNSLRVIE